MRILKPWKIKRLVKKLRQMRQFSIHNQPKDEDIKKEQKAYLALAQLYKASIGQKKYPFADILMLECLRNAANLGNAEAQYQAGRYLLEQGKFREKLHKEGLFDSMVNARQRDACYEEAHLLLQEAEKFNHIGAKRLRGLSLINGWGVVSNAEKGFDLIVESIEKEGSWDKVPQLFADMQLNKPEFFTAVMKRRGK